MIEFVNYYYYNEDENEFWQDLEEHLGIEESEDYEKIKNIFLDTEKEEKFSIDHFDGHIAVTKKEINNKTVTIIDNLNLEHLYLIIEKENSYE